MNTNVFVVAQSINSLGQIEAIVGKITLRLSGPLVESDIMHLSEQSAREARDRLESLFGDQVNED